MVSRLEILAAIAVLVFAVVACSAQGEPAPRPAPAAPAPGAPGAPVEAIAAAPAPVQQQLQTAQPEGFNTIGGSATVNDAAYDLTFFKHYGVNPFIDTEDDHLSTFAIDVDTASYTVARKFVQDGNMPDPDSVRVEEFVNYFDYGYEAPEEGAFAIHVEGSPSPFGSEKHWLLRVGLQGETVSEEARKDATLVFAIDVSGSMAREDRLELVKKSLRLLVDELRPADEVGIVVYGDRGSVLLEPTDGGEKSSIMRAIERLSPRRVHVRRGRPEDRIPHGVRTGAAGPRDTGDAAVRRRWQCRKNGSRFHTRANQGTRRRGRDAHDRRIRHG